MSRGAAGAGRGAVHLRDATSADAGAMAELLNAIIDDGGTTAHLRPFDAARMQRHYISPPLAISCFLAEKSGTVLGFQALEWCDPDWPGPDRLPPDWAVIASFVSAAARGRGIGGALFARSRKAALGAGVRAIDATIRADNPAGLGFYASIGFFPYARMAAVPLSNGVGVDRIRKRYELGVKPGQARPA